MIRHIVMFKTKEMPEKEKMVAIEKLKAAIDVMEDGVPEVRFLQTGININLRPQAFDLVLVSDFESNEDFNTYRNHPMHQKVMDVIKEVVDRVHVVDFPMET